MALIQSDSLWLPIGVAIFFTVVQIIESNIVTPKVLGDKVNLSPLAVLIASMYWGWLWGGIGVILAVPITAALKVVCDHIDSLKPIGILLGGRKD
jgi:predicted PurR-regulated permease PerM